MQDKKLHNVEIVLEKLKSHYRLRTYRELAAFLEVKEGTLNAWKTRNKIGDVDLILTRCRGLSYNWLKTGEGEAFGGSDSEYTLGKGLRDYREAHKMSQEDVASALGFSVDLVSELEDDSTIPDSDTRRKIMELLGFSKVVYDSRSKESELSDVKPKSFMTEPNSEVSSITGGGAPAHSEQIVDFLTFKADWLKASLGLVPNNVVVISVIGDNMEPYLADGDLIMVDFGVTRIENDAVYVLQFGDSLLVKRVQVKLDGEITVKSDNPRYESETYRGESAKHLQVMGRVVRRLVR